MQYKAQQNQAVLLEGRIPYRLLHDEKGRLKFKWLFTGDLRYTEPFFDESISACLSLPENSSDNIPVTGIEELFDYASGLESVRPSCFIFHISRCGSTLLSQMMSEEERCIVLSEVPILDDLLQLRYHPAVRSMPPIEKLFKAVLHILGQRKAADEKYLAIKLDSWHTLFYDDLRAWFPAVPFFLMHRNPAEVIRSHAKQPGRHAVPGVLEPSMFGLNYNMACAMPAGMYLQYVLTCYLKKYLEILGSGNDVYMLNYHDGSVSMVERVIRICNMEISETLTEKMITRAGFHSKSPKLSFSGDGQVTAVQHTSPELEQLFQKLILLSGKSSIAN